MKNIYTLLKLCVITSFALLLPQGKALAQFPNPPVFEDAVCALDTTFLFLSYEAVSEDEADPENLTVVLNVVVPEPNPAGIDALTFLAPGPGAILVTYTLDELIEDPFVELVVDREVFLTTPDVIVTAIDYVPLIGTIIIPWPLYIIDFQARLDTDDPCLPITPLPVELSRFEGKATQSGISLEWETASEINNSHFEIERSADGSAFEQLGSVAGHSNSVATIEYSYLDKHPNPGTNYYRLRQVDFDGKYEYSNVIAVTAPETTQALQVQVVPNPCLNGDCQLRIATATAGQPVRVQLKDLSGRVVFEQSMQHDGEPLQLTQAQLQRLRGVFILSAVAGQEVVRQRVVLE
ncbi:hypothetical protein [Pontibacter chinhatensis]|uniref:Por secretion system C-terminal sorting domain-containing protein n=1 Tax=Pontibacter chinhatensis TaxID=1436961 RepID=A0A1I2ZAQ6_9BACT|nr:hypothetical protein [Pontibacter chinhatensis]SFH34171.1 Por secretion system C-terminal sorting domain-containing protein [Pontibacter chinhatensis]